MGAPRLELLEPPPSPKAPAGAAPALLCAGVGADLWAASPCQRVGPLWRWELGAVRSRAHGTLSCSEAAAALEKDCFHRGGGGSTQEAEVAWSWLRARLAVRF